MLNYLHRREINVETVAKRTKSEEQFEKGMNVDDESNERTAGKVENVQEGTLEEQKGITIEPEAMEAKEELVEGENKMAVDENSPVSLYWKEKECQPCVHPGDAVSLGTVIVQ